MTLLTKKKKRKLLNLVAANQIMINAFDSLEDYEKIETFSRICSNNANIIFTLGGMSALEEAKEFIFTKEPEND